MLDRSDETDPRRGIGVWGEGESGLVGGASTLTCEKALPFLGKGEGYAAGWERKRGQEVISVTGDRGTRLCPGNSGWEKPCHGWGSDEMGGKARAQSESMPIDCGGRGPEEEIMFSRLDR